MSAFARFRRCLLFCLAIAITSAARSATPAGPDERDRKVIESLLLHLVADAKFDVTRVPTNGASIVLHVRTPEKTGFLTAGQMHSDIGEHKLPTDAETDLRRRNTPADAKPGSYDSVTASYTNLAFGPAIVVTDLTETWKGEFGVARANSFAEQFPQARGWLELYLPGYSDDGTHAIVRGPVGPWAHAAMLTAELEKVGEKWTVKWYHIARFA